MAGALLVVFADLKQAILDKDWADVELAYEGLTGEKITRIEEDMDVKPLEMPKVMKGKPPKKPKGGKPPKGKPKPYKAPPQDKVVVNKKSGKPITFFSEGCDEDKGIVCPKKTDRREPIEMMEVKCDKCGRKEQVNPNYFNLNFMGQTSKYKCSRCIG